MSRTSKTLGLALLISAINSPVALADPVVIDFSSGIASSTAHTSTYQQDGFTAFSTENTPPASPPFTLKWDFTGGVAVKTAMFDPGTFDIRAGVGQFTLQSFQVAESDSDFTDGCARGPGMKGESVFVTGMLAGATVFSWSAASMCPPRSFTTYANPYAGVLVDDVVFRAIGLDTMLVDNIVLTPVPEPSTFGLMAACLSAFGLARRRRRG